MSTNRTSTKTVTRPDPKRPYKAYAAAVGALAVGILDQTIWNIPQPYETILTILASGCSAFVIPNPARRRKTPRDPRRNQAGPPRVI
jgi:hypothetical protein